MNKENRTFFYENGCYFTIFACNLTNCLSLLINTLMHCARNTLYRNYSKYWHHFWDYRYGNCFTFNGGIDDNGDNQKVLISHNTGPDGGSVIHLGTQSFYITHKPFCCCSLLLSFSFTVLNFMVVYKIIKIIEKKVILIKIRITYHLLRSNN